MPGLAAPGTLLKGGTSVGAVRPDAYLALFFLFHNVVFGLELSLNSFYYFPFLVRYFCLEPMFVPFHGILFCDANST